jgi:hypothetical protein
LTAPLSFQQQWPLVQESDMTVKGLWLRTLPTLTCNRLFIQVQGIVRPARKGRLFDLYRANQKSPKHSPSTAKAA